MNAHTFELYRENQRLTYSGVPPACLSNWYTASMSLKRTDSLEVLAGWEEEEPCEDYNPLDRTWSNEAVCDGEWRQQKKTKGKSNEVSHITEERVYRSKGNRSKDNLRKDNLRKGHSRLKKVIFGDTVIKSYLVDTIKKKTADRIKKRREKKNKIKMASNLGIW